MEDSPKEKVQRTIPLSAGIAFLVAVLTGWSAIQAVHARLDRAGEDRFKGSDMDRFIERMQVEMDKQALQSGQPLVEVPTWRPR